MRVATYAQRTAATRASLIAVVLLTLTILQGTSALLTLVYYFNKSLEPITFLLWVASYLLALGGLMLTHGLNWVFWLFRYRLLLVLLLFGVIASIGWSIDPNVSTSRVFHLVGSTLIAIYLGFMVPLETTLNVLARVLGVILIASIAAVFLLPGLGIENYEGSQVWKGIVTSKNTLGFWAAAGVLLYISQWSRAMTGAGKSLCIAMAAISFGILIASKSATSLLALIVGGAVALYFYIAHRFQLGFVRMVVMALLFTGLIIVAFLNIDTAELVGRSGDLTGRGEVWEQTWNLILNKPLTGYGYGSIWNPNDATIWIQQKLTDFTWVVYHAHNGFLQIASEIGLPLSLIAILMIVQQLIEIFYCQYQRQQIGVLFVLGFVLTYLVTNYSEARFLVNRELYWILFLALPISMLRQVTVVIPDGADPHTDEDDGPLSDNGPQTEHGAQNYNGARPVYAQVGAASQAEAQAQAGNKNSRSAQREQTERLKAQVKRLEQNSDGDKTFTEDRRRGKKPTSQPKPDHKASDLDAVLDGTANDTVSVESIDDDYTNDITAGIIVDDDDKFDGFDDAILNDMPASESDTPAHGGVDIDLSRLQKKRNK